MNGKEHYEEAERLLDHTSRNRMTVEQWDARIAEAQVHATLALAWSVAQPPVYISGGPS